LKKGWRKYALVDMKLAKPSSLAKYVKVRQPKWNSEAERVVQIQERMQNVAPALLSETKFRNEYYVIRELQPSSDKIDFTAIQSFSEIKRVIKDMAMLTASSQLRSSGRQGSAIADELIQMGSDTHWQERVLAYALKYSGKVKKDFQQYRAAFKKGFFA
jgi:uncharacterized protein (DUF2252 family)